MIGSSKKLLLVVALACAQPTSTIRAGYYPADDNSGVAVALAFGGAVVAGLGIYTLCDWLFSRTNEQVLADARRMTGDADNRYIPVRDLFIAHLGDDSHYAPAEYSMPLLEAIARQECTNYSIDTYLHNLDTFVKSMRSEYAEIEKRMRSLEKSSRKKSQNELVYQGLQAFRSELHKRLVKLERIQTFLEFHRGYFNLSSHYNEMYANYSPVLANLAYVLQYPAAIHTLAPLIMANKHVNNHRFIFLDYFNMLDRDTASFNKSINAVHAVYQPLISAASLMARDLELLKGVIRSSDRYNQEYHQWQVEEMQRKQLEMQMALVQAQQKQAEAERQKAKALKERNEIEAQKLALQKKELQQKQQQKGDTTVVVVVEQKAQAAPAPQQSQPSAPPLDFDYIYDVFGA